MSPRMGTLKPNLLPNPIASGMFYYPLFILSSKPKNRNGNTVRKYAMRMKTIKNFLVWINFLLSYSCEIFKILCRLNVVIHKLNESL